MAIGIVIGLYLYVVCTGKFFRKTWKHIHDFADEINKKRIEKKDRKTEEQETNNKHEITITPIQNPENSNRQNELVQPQDKMETFGSKMKRHLKINMIFYDGAVLLIIVIILTGLQILLIHTFKHNFKQTLIGNYRNANESIVYKMCNVLQRQYLSEELIYGIIAMFILLTIFITHQSKRFSNYIMIKYCYFFKKKVYKNSIEKEEEKRKKDRKTKLDEMSRCQRCRYKTKNNCFCKFLSCFFCCTCCGGKKKEKNSSSHGCCYTFCCCELCANTDCCKIVCMIVRILKLLLCIDFWCCIREKIMKKRDESKENDRELESKDESQELSDNKYKWPIPLLPYSTTNRLLSVAVYVAYTYDILNIFTYLYSSFLSIPLMPFLKNKDGVLKDFIIQILQVVIIGFKFYPILAVADIEPHVATYSISFLYILVMWVIKLLNKGFCSRTEAFVKFSIEQIENQVHNSKLMRWNQRLNLTSRFEDGETDETEESRYRKIVNDKIPSLFEKFFGSKAETITSTPSILPTLMTQSMNLTVSRSGFRKKIANKTVGFMNDFFDGWNQEETDWATTMRNLLENLPLYISLSFLLARFLVTSVQLSIKLFDRCCSNCKGTNLSDQDHQSLEALKNMVFKLSTNDKFLASKRHHICNIYDKKYGISKYRIKNHNYDYVTNILTSIRIFEGIQDDENEKTISFCLAQLHKLKRIYDPVKHFRFSKQVVNTFMIAFMLLYFFTVFIVRTSTVFGAWLVRSIQLIFQIMFGSILPSFSFQDHNLNVEFAVACLITSLICFIQLLLSLKSFQKYILELHRGGELSNKNLKDNAKSKGLFLNLFKEDQHADISSKLNLGEMMASHSLHYPGYLIAHLTYSYFLMFAILFIVIVVFKLIWYIPQAVEFILQIFLPIALLFFLRLLSVKTFTRHIFRNNDSNFLTNLTPYFVVSYFNFFFDCFLGFVACMNRVWQTTIISLFYLPRLDKTMFNEKHTLLLQQMDKGHLAYLNFVHMEHLYNNPVLITFSDILIELMFISYIKKSQLKTHIRKSLLKQNSKNNNEKSEDSLRKLKSKTPPEQQEQNKATNEDDKYLKSISVDFERRQNFIEAQENLILSQISEVPDENSADTVANFDSKKRKLFEQKLSLVVTKQPQKFEHTCTENADDDDDDDDDVNAKLKSKFERQVTIRSVNGKSIYEEELIETSVQDEIIFSISPKREKEIKNTEVKKQQERFKYQSYRRLCNIFYMYVLLKENKILCDYTADTMIKKKKTNIVKKQRESPKSESFRETLKRISGSSGSSSSSSNSKISTAPRYLRRQSRTEEKSYLDETYFEDDEEDDDKE